MNTLPSLDKFKEYCQIIIGCCAPYGFNQDVVEQMEEVVFQKGTMLENDATCETIVRMKDGRYGLMYEFSDYTGHG